MSRRKLADQIAGNKLRRIASLPDLLCDEECRNGFIDLEEQIRREREQELTEAGKSAHPIIQQEFSAEAGFLIGLQIGRQLAKGAE
jgi:hypothetical protein